MPSNSLASRRNSEAGRRLGGTFRLALSLAAVIVLLDQASKWLILTQVMDPPRVIEVTGFFNLVLTYNTGISFGLFGGNAAWQPWILVALSLAIVAGLLWWLRSQDRVLPIAAIGLIVGGAIGNVIDRTHLPGVADFLDVHAAGWHWPAFNVADSAITIGVALLIFDGLFGDAERGK